MGALPNPAARCSRLLPSASLAARAHFFPSGVRSRRRRGHDVIPVKGFHKLFIRGRSSMTWLSLAARIALNWSSKPIWEAVLMNWSILSMPRLSMPKL